MCLFKDRSNTSMDSKFLIELNIFNSEALFKLNLVLLRPITGALTTSVGQVRVPNSFPVFNNLL